MDLNYLYFGHFWMINHPKMIFQQIYKWIAVIMKKQKLSFPKKSHDVPAKRFFNRVKERIRELNIRDDHEVYFLIKVDGSKCTGIINYFTKKCCYLVFLAKMCNK